MFKRLIKILSNLKDNEDCECIGALILNDQVEERYVTLIENTYIRQIISSSKEIGITNLPSFKNPILFIIIQWDKKNQKKFTVLLNCKIYQEIYKFINMPFI